MERYLLAKKASVVGIIGNVFLFIIKVVVGFVSHSQAMIADAFNSASDIFNSVISYVGSKISSKEADEDHNLGHGKAEYIYSMLISITMILLGLTIFKDSFFSLYEKDYYVFSKWLLVVCAITIIVKIGLFIYTSSIGKKHHNLLVEASSKDHRNDVLLTSLTLLSVILSYYNINYIDSIVGMIISLWIVYNGVLIFIESYDVLMDKTMPQELKDKIMEIINSHEEIYKVNHFNSTPVGYRYHISFTIFVDGNLSTFDSHDIANRLEKEIDKKVPEVYLTVIHVNPVDKRKGD
jgi:cation diffusion facilitator family transporter